MAQQAGVRLPSGAEPGREPLQPAMPESSGGGQPITVPKSAATEAPAGSEKFSFTLASVAIEGVTAYGADDLKPLYAGLIGKQVTVSDMFKVANEIEVRYRGAGYVTTRVIVPQQTIENGQFRIIVLEGFISEITYPDDIGPAKAAVQRLLAPLIGVAPINVADIERSLLLANDLPGLTVRASLEPSPAAPGGSVIVVHTIRKPIDASLTFDNRNTPYVGSAEWVGAVAYNSFGPHADQVTVNSKISSPLDRAWFVNAAYQGLFSDDGLTLGFSSSFGRANPGEDLDPLNVHSRVLSEVGTATYPIIRSRLQNLRVFTEFEYRDISTDVSGAAFNRDHLRILRAGLSYDRTDTWDGITAVRATVHQGLDIFDATDHGAATASRPDGNSTYTKVTMAVTRVQQLPDNFSVLATATSQFSNKPLLASEQIALGGPNFGRAYDEGEISGDNGWAGSVELRYSPSVPDVLPDGVQFYTLFDGGQVWSKGTTHITLASFGGGVRANLTENVLGTLEVDQPIDREVLTQGGKPTRVFFTITAHY